MIEQNYLQLLIQSLEKKITVLDHIVQLNDQQKNLLLQEMESHRNYLPDFNDETVFKD